MNDFRLAPRELEGLAGVVGERIGLHYPPEKWIDLDRALKAATRDAGFDSPRELAHAIISGSVDDDQLGRFASCLTIGETYFFRDAKSFLALEQHVLPELSRARPQADRIRIWSAGCSEGPEAYSISITCMKMLPALGAVRATILGTDVDRRALDRAKAGVYTPWSLRDTPPGFARDYFTPTGSQRYELNARVRDGVEFAYHNLVGGNRTPVPEGTRNADIIFCRNVLMYFTPEQRAAAADRLQHALAQGGYLFVAPSEVAHQLFPELELVRLAGMFCFHKTSPIQLAIKPSAKGDESRQPQRRRSPTKAASGRRPAQSHEVVSNAGFAEGPDSVSKSETALVRAKTLADAGRAEEALKLCDGVTAEMQMSAEYSFLRATILQELERWDEAAEALKRVLYLEPDFALAHFVLGNLALRAGETRAAERHFSALSRLLRAMPPERVLPGSDGMTAGELRAVMTAGSGGR